MAYLVRQVHTVNVDRYILPLREGGSVPGLVDADNGNQYVIKFRGSAQGHKVLISELIGGEVARVLGLHVPEIVFAELGEVYGRTEQNEEIQKQIKASAGLNIGLRYLPGAISFDPIVSLVDAALASQIVWLDCLITNPDRTASNPNMLSWNNQLWLIDHGASLFFHYTWDAPPVQLALRPFGRIAQHVLLPYASLLDITDRDCRTILTPSIIHDIVSMIPEDWLRGDSPFESENEHRRAYEQFLLTRIEHSNIFLKDAKHARQEAI